MKKICFVFFISLFFTNTVLAVLPVGCTAKREHTKLADFGKGAMPAAAFVVSVYKRDWMGAAISQALAHGLYPLNRMYQHKIHKKRPCGCDGAFPSGHMIMYAASSSYLHYRYGWRYGIPAYVATVVFAADRVNNKAHSWIDMLGTFAIINLFTYFVTPEYSIKKVIVPPEIAGLEDDIKYLSYIEERKPQIYPSIQTVNKGIMLGFRVKM